MANNPVTANTLSQSVVSFSHSTKLTNQSVVSFSHSTKLTNQSVVSFSHSTKLTNQLVVSFSHSTKQTNQSVVSFSHSTKLTNQLVVSFSHSTKLTNQSVVSFGHNAKTSLKTTCQVLWQRKKHTWQCLGQKFKQLGCTLRTGCAPADIHTDPKTIYQSCWKWPRLSLWSRVTKDSPAASAVQA